MTLDIFLIQEEKLGYLLLEVFLFELEEGLEGLLVGCFSDAHEDQQEGVACGAQTQKDELDEEVFSDLAYLIAPHLQSSIELGIELIHYVKIVGGDFVVVVGVGSRNDVDCLIAGDNGLADQSLQSGWDLGVK